MSDQAEWAAPDAGLPWRDGDDVLVLDASVLADRHKVVLDTDSLTNPHASKVLAGQLLLALTQAGAKALTSVRTVDALQAGLKSRHRASVDAAKRGAGVLKAFQDAQSVVNADDPHVIAGDPLDTATLLTELFVGYQQREALCLITQNASLAWAVLRNARSGAFNRAAPVVAAYVAHDGLRNWAPELANQPVLPSSRAGSSEDDVHLALRDCRVFVDTCSWMLEDKAQPGSDRGASFLLNVVKPLLEQYRNPLMVPDRVRLELEHHVNSHDAEHALALAGLGALAQFRKAGLAILASDPDEAAGNARFADPVFVRLAVRFQSEFDLCFVTQDTKLATLLLACRQPGTGRKFLVTFIPMKGKTLLPWSVKLNKSSGEGKPPRRPDTTPQHRPKTWVAPGTDHHHRHEPATPRAPSKPRCQGFRILTELNRPDATPLAVSELPEAGHTVVGAKSGPLVLVEKIAGGGEGTVYRTTRDGLVCKVYHRECLTLGRNEKLELMCSREVHIEGVCWPVELVHTVHGEFVGFLMPAASGKMLRTSVFAKVLLAKHFPQWSRVELTELAITMLRAIRELHFIGVLVGDVNPQNILVKGPKHIAIVDADSFQVEGYACAVGTETFTPPNLQGMAYTDFLRSHDDELYAVATLLFETLFPGKAPYSAQGGGDVSENIKNMRFAYGREADGRPPVGPWQFIWSHLHPRLKEDFTAVFARGERVGINDFVQHLEWSLKEMHAGTRDNSIFPDKPWQREGQTVTMRCDACPADKAMHEVSQHLAERLRAEGKGFLCSACAAMKKMNRLQNTREVDCELRTSPECEGRAQASIVHLESLKRSGKPYWCRPCANRQKELWAAERSARPARHGSHAGGRAQPPSSTCFVATAVYQDPMAESVVALRRYRDTMLVRHVMGRVFIAAYDVVGPWLAKGVEMTPWTRPILKRVLDAIAAPLSRRFPPDTAQVGGRTHE